MHHISQLIFQNIEGFMAGTVTRIDLLYSCCLDTACQLSDFIRLSCIEMEASYDGFNFFAGQSLLNLPDYIVSTNASKPSFSIKICIFS